MRTPLLLVVAALCACSASEVVQDGHTDAGGPEVDGNVLDATSAADGPIEADSDAGPVCTATNRGDTCVPVVGSCASGYRYGCFGSTCSTTDLGKCTVANDNPAARYTEVCCERQACVRSKAPLDEQCADLNATLMDGRLTGWTCPYANGVALATPPGKPADCRRRASSVPSDSTAADYCCK